MSVGTALVTSFLVTLARPMTWLLALAAFLARGGVLVVLTPIVVLPSAVGVGNALAPTITALVFGTGVAAVAALLAAGVGLLLAWLVLGGFVAALAEAECIRIVAADEEVGAGTPGLVTDPGRVGVGARILLVRLVALVPVAIALAWGASRLIGATYRELTVPSETATPLVIRVLVAAPDGPIVILVAWLVGGILASAAVRAIAFRGDGVGRSLVHGGAWAIRHPLHAVVLEVVPLAGLVLVLVPSAAAASTAWSAVRAWLADGSGAFVAIGLVALFVALWLGGLALAGVLSAWRAAAWTAGLAGTFVPNPPDRAGDWNGRDPSGTVADLRPRGVDPDTR